MNPPKRTPPYTTPQSGDGDGSTRSRTPAAAVTPPGGRAATPADAASTDRDLVRRMATGDETALGVLYDKWSPLVHSLVLRLLHDSNEAEEVVEDTFWQAWRQANRYNEARGAVSTWVTTIGRSRALDRIRAKRRQKEDPWSSFEPSEMAEVVRDMEGADPQKGAESSERRTIVIAALRQLPREQRETIEMAYFGGFSQSEIATLTKQPLGTVKTRVRLAMEKLRERLSMLRDSTK